MLQKIKQYAITKNLATEDEIDQGIEKLKDFYVSDLRKYSATKLNNNFISFYNRPHHNFLSILGFETWRDEQEKLVENEHTKSLNTMLSEKEKNNESLKNLNALQEKERIALRNRQKAERENSIVLNGATWETTLKRIILNHNYYVKTTRISKRFDCLDELLYEVKNSPQEISQKKYSTWFSEDIINVLTDVYKYSDTREKNYFSTTCRQAELLQVKPIIYDDLIQWAYSFLFNRRTWTDMLAWYKFTGVKAELPFELVDSMVSKLYVPDKNVNRNEAFYMFEHKPVIAISRTSTYHPTQEKLTAWGTDLLDYENFELLQRTAQWFGKINLPIDNIETEYIKRKSYFDTETEKGVFKDSETGDVLRKIITSAKDLPTVVYEDIITVLKKF